MAKITQADIDALPIDRKIELVEAIWDSIAASPEAIQVPDWHTEILTRRRADPRPDEEDSWDNVKQRIQKRQ